MGLWVGTPQAISPSEKSPQTLTSWTKASPFYPNFLQPTHKPQLEIENEIFTKAPLQKAPMDKGPYISKLSNAFHNFWIY